METCVDMDTNELKKEEDVDPFEKSLWDDAEMEEAMTESDKILGMITAGDGQCQINTKSRDDVEGTASFDGSLVKMEAVEENLPRHHSYRTENRSAPQCEFQGFTTASGKAVNISAAALELARRLWVDNTEEFNRDAREAVGKFEDPLVAQERVSSCTIHERKFESNVPVDEAQDLKPFMEVRVSPIAGTSEGIDAKELGDERSDDKIDQVCKSKTSSCGFSTTASDKSVNVSTAEPQLESTRALNDVMDTMYASRNELSCGFSTASGKSIIASAAALKRARSLWDEATSSEQLSSFTNETSREIPVANGKIGVGLAGANDRIGSGSFSKTNEAKKLSSICGRFSTVGGKSVTVSAVAPERAKHLWDRVNSEANAPKSSNHLFAGRKTSPQDKISQHEHDSIIDQEFSPTETGSKSEFSLGFATASGKSVAISATALERARSLWNEATSESDLSKSLSDAINPVVLANERSSLFTEMSEPSFGPHNGDSRTSPGQSNAASWVSDNANAAHQNPPSKAVETPTMTTGGDSGENLQENSLQILEECSDSGMKKFDKIEALRKDLSGPLHTSTPVSTHSVYSDKKIQPRGYLTPFRTTVTPSDSRQHRPSPLNGMSDGEIPQLKSLANNSNVATVPRRTLGARLGRSASTSSKTKNAYREPMKRSRSSLEEIVNNTSSTKAPKMSKQSFEVTFDTKSTTPNSSIVSNGTASFNISITESQEVLESSKALLEDEDAEMKDEDLLEGSVVDGPLPFDAICQGGNPVPYIRAIVTRVYPIVYACKSQDKKIDFYSELSYERLQKYRESYQQAEMENVLARVEAEMKKAHAGKSPVVPLSCLHKENLERMCVDDLLRIFESGDDFCDIKLLLSSNKLQQLQEARDKKREEYHRMVKTEVEKRMKNSMCGFSSVTPVLKIRLTDISNFRSSKPLRHALMSFWRPSEDLLNHVVEGAAFNIHCVTLGHSIQDELRLNSMRGTQIQRCEHSLAADVLHRIARRWHLFQEILADNFTPLFNEFDFVGVVVLVDDQHNDTTGQIVYFADESENILGLRLWKSMKDEGLEKILTVGNALSVSNVQWRQSSRATTIPRGFVQDTTRFFTRPKESDARSTIERLQSFLKTSSSYITECQWKIRSVLNTGTDGCIMDAPKTPPLARRIQPQVKSDEQMNLLL